MNIAGGRGRLLVFALSMAALGAGIGRRVEAKGRKGGVTGQSLACEADADCVLVTDGCCGCNEGGKRRAVPVKARDAYEKKRKAMCHDTACPALMSEDPSCQAAGAVCKNGSCALGS